MARVKCDSCGDEHECAAVSAPTGGATGGGGGKAKRGEPAAFKAHREKQKREAEARRAGSQPGGGSAEQPKRSVIRDLLGF